MAILTSVKDNQITLASGATVTFPFPVGDAVEYDAVVVIRLEMPESKSSKGNVMGVAPDGRIIWRIGPDQSPYWPSPWLNLENRDGNAVLLYYDRTYAYVDPQTGSLIRRGKQIRFDAEKGMTIYAEDNRLFLPTGAVVTFQFPIGWAADFGDVIVVQVQPPRGTIFNENVYGVGLDGHVIWQIQPEYPSNHNGAWSGLERIGDNAVLSNTESQVRHVDPKTGKILKRYISVR